MLLTKGLFGYNWKLKLKTEKYCSKIIFKCMNGTVRPIFNEKVAEKWNLWVCKQCTVCTDWLKRMRKVKLCGYYSLNNAWTIPISLTNACQKKKKRKKRKEKRQTPNANAQSKRSLSTNVESSWSLDIRIHTQNFYNNFIKDMRYYFVAVFYFDSLLTLKKKKKANKHISLWISLDITF